MPANNPWTPQVNGTVSVVPSTGSNVVALAAGGGAQVRVLNVASVTVFVGFGASTITVSTSTDLPILANSSEHMMFTVAIATGPNSSAPSYMGYISSASAAAATSFIYASRGEGF